MSNHLVLNGKTIPPGSRTTLELELPQLYTHTPLHMPVQVVRGRTDGPRLFVSGAIHGDELNGVEIIRRLLKRAALKRLRGTLIAIPVVNIYGFIHNARYLPDRRDLNRSFPGSDHGSLAARLADLFMSEIVTQCDHGIDLHTGAVNRSNLPQVRADLDDEHTARLARAFGVPVILNASLRDGSLRQAASERGISMLLYEAGEALRFDEASIRVGLQGVLNVMRALGMLPLTRKDKRVLDEPFVARSSTWVRAPRSGVLRSLTPLGAHTQEGDVLGLVADPFGESEAQVRAHAGGVVIGRSNIPVVHEGEALFHIARFEDSQEVAEQLEVFQADLEESIEADPNRSIL